MCIKYSSQVSVQKKKKCTLRKNTFLLKQIKVHMSLEVIKAGLNAIFAFILGIPVKDGLFFYQQLNSPALLQSCRMIQVRPAINCLHFSEHEIC